MSYYLENIGGGHVFPHAVLMWQAQKEHHVLSHVISKARAILQEHSSVAIPHVSYKSKGEIYMKIDIRCEGSATPLSHSCVDRVRISAKRDPSVLTHF
jgi:hypothetical protein